VPPRSTVHQWPVLPSAAHHLVVPLPSLPLAAGFAVSELSADAALPWAMLAPDELVDEDELEELLELDELDELLETFTVKVWVQVPPLT
jgi:hypothetical protein